MPKVSQEFWKKAFPHKISAGKREDFLSILIPLSCTSFLFSGNLNYKQGFPEYQARAQLQLWYTQTRSHFLCIWCSAWWRRGMETKSFRGYTSESSFLSWRYQMEKKFCQPAPTRKPWKISSLSTLSLCHPHHILTLTWVPELFDRTEGQTNLGEVERKLKLIKATVTIQTKNILVFRFNNSTSKMRRLRWSA